MNRDPLDTGTWRRERCLYWLFDLPMESGESPVDAMARYARRMLRVLGGFAIPAGAEWTTASAGEDALVHGRGTVIDEAALAAAFEAFPDVYSLTLRLDLLLTPDGQSEVVLPEGANVVLEFEEDGRLVADLSLDVDIYAYRTLGRDGDNTRLARLNAPRLFAALSRLQGTVGARLVSIDARERRIGEQYAQWLEHPLNPTTA